ncbi:hypothetical protein GWI33_005023 [Rhynchophorus ferrugineus]|uniref:Uncharacterized protein n=1 Tax=Rhynchophorus ferrugineus TaxID=354439 RepID=A0A834MIC7_RHYFE|nr:hypothetical protein GWI33_005023 [Rhynchophorus ferrugineus]
MLKTIAILGFCALIIAQCGANGDNEHHQKVRHYHHRSNGDNHHKTHQEKDHIHHHHIVRSSHQKQFKQRSLNNSGCSWFCYEQQFWSVFALFNGTKELEILYNILPKPTYIRPGSNSTNGSCGISPINNSSLSNSTQVLLNSTVVPINVTCGNNSGQWVSPFKNSTSPYPIFSFLLRSFIEFLADSRGIKFLFSSTTIFSSLWKDVVTHINSINRTGILSQNLNTLFGCNGSLGANLFNLTYTESLISNLSTGGIIKGFEQGAEALLNISGLYRGGQNLTFQNPLLQ